MQDFPPKRRHVMSDEVHVIITQKTAGVTGSVTTSFANFYTNGSV
jgi:hypothetical protein